MVEGTERPACAPWAC